MAAAELKTQKTTQSVDEFLTNVADERVRADCYAIIAMMEKSTGSTAQMWGSSIVGLGHYHYKYESGRENDWFQLGFSPRKQNIALYLMGRNEDLQELLLKLGKYKTGKSCIYIKKLAEVDVNILQQLFDIAVEQLKKA